MALNRYTIEVWYDADDGENIVGVGEALADVVFEQDGVEHVLLHGPRSHVVVDPTADIIERNA